MTDLDFQIKSMIESGVTHREIMDELGISYFTLRKSLGVTKARKPLPRGRREYLSKFGVLIGNAGSELDTMADFEIEALIQLCSAREKTVFGALLDFWLEHTDI